VQDQGTVVSNKGNPVVSSIVSAIYAGRMFPQKGKSIEFIKGLQGVRGLGGIIGISELASHGHHRFRKICLHPVQGIIDQVYPPIGHQTPCVVPKPPEVEMETVFIERRSEERRVGKESRSRR